MLTAMARRDRRGLAKLPGQPRRWRNLGAVVARWATALLVLPAAPTPAHGQYRTCGTRSTEPCAAPNSLRFTAISAGKSHSCALTREGVAWCWGDGGNGALGDGTRLVQRWPQLVKTPQRFVEIDAGGEFTCARTESGAIYCWGNERVVPGWPEVATTPVLVRTDVRAAGLTTGRRHACVLDEEGRASCWGFNVDGETGTGVAGIQAAMIPRPQTVVGDHRFRALSAGFGFTCGISLDGAVHCWGSNVDGAIGEGAGERCADVASVGCSTSPVRINSPHRFTSVAAGTAHVCALTTEGAVLCWGSNAVGQLGFFNKRTMRVDSPRLVEFGQDVRVTSIHSGGIQSCALTARQEVYCWGADPWTFPDPAFYADQLAPRQPAGRRAFTAVSAGQQHVCALDTAGIARCWGDTVRGAFGIR